MVAGIAPASRTRRSDSRATAGPVSAGSPWAISDDSSATTGAERMSASSISGEIVSRVEGWRVTGRCYTRRGVHQPGRSRALRQPSTGRDGPQLRQLRDADLPRLHGPDAGGIKCRNCARQPRSARVTLRPDRAGKAMLAAAGSGTAAGVVLAYAGYLGYGLSR